MSNKPPPQSLKHLPEIADCIHGHILRGIEKEGLRINPNGHIAQTPHPIALGSKLTNPYITTDFSEALLEFITPPQQNIAQMLSFLQKLHAFSYQSFKSDEIIWAASMPCTLTKESDIPIANYGKSNMGMMKTIYRQGLSHRYGKNMQTIAGIHFNFSMTNNFWLQYQHICQDQSDLQSFKNEHYFKLIRNFFRYEWVLNLLYGASPAACASFNQANELGLTVLDSKSLFGKYATSLRMSDIGYNNKAQSALNIPYSSMEAYCEALNRATRTKHQDFCKIPVKNDNQYMQLNQNILQIEAEYYSPIRPKCVTHSGERPIQALLERGVEYVEVRLLDINPFESVGITESQIKFLDVFMLYCLLLDSPNLSKQEMENIQHNHKLIVNQGREPQLKLKAESGESKPLSEFTEPLASNMLYLASSLDDANPKMGYLQSVKQAFAKLESFTTLPSSIIIDKMQNQNQCFFDIALEESLKHRAFFQNFALSDTDKSHFMEMASSSINKQQQIENSETISLDEQIELYFR